MPGNIAKIIPVNPDLSVIISKKPSAMDGTYIMIKQNQKLSIQGETLLRPEEIPGLVEALTDAADEVMKLNLTPINSIKNFC